MPTTGSRWREGEADARERDGMRAVSVVEAAGRAIVAAGLVWLALGAAPARADEAANASAAAAVPAAGESADEVLRLRQRAAGFWAARVARDFRQQWTYMEPRLRGKVSQDEYRHGRGTVGYLAYQVEDATITGNFATVKVRLVVDVTVTTMQGGTRRVPRQTVVLDDPWVRVGGVWHRRMDGDERTAQAPVP
jgi:hypothetical protein